MRKLKFVFVVYCVSSDSNIHASGFDIDSVFDSEYEAKCFCDYLNSHSFFLYSYKKVKFISLWK